MGKTQPEVIQKCTCEETGGTLKDKAHQKPKIGNSENEMPIWQ